MEITTPARISDPWLLCSRIVECAKQRVLCSGALQPHTLAEQVNQPHHEAAGRLVLGALPRGLRVKPLVAEFVDYVQVCSPPQSPELIDDYLKKLPKGARVTSRRVVSAGDLRVSSESPSPVFLGPTQTTEAATVELCWLGIPGDQDSFLDRAIKAGHPRGLEVFTSQAMDSVVKANFLEPPHVLAKKRTDFFRRWTARARALHGEENQLRSAMPEHVKKILGQKRLVLFGEILNDLGYPDKALISDMAEGFRLSGYMPKTGVFRAKSRRPSISLDTLRKLAKGFNESALKSLLRRQENSLEEATWHETELELKKGWIWLDESNDLNGKFLGRRFGLAQGCKVRVIDDCSLCGLNMTMVSHCFNEAGWNKLPKVLGRTYDLKSAYKQFAVHPSDRAALRMGVNKPGCDKPLVIGFNSLPFGSVGSVAAFLIHAVWFVGFHALGLLWSAFYDDFSILSREELVPSASWACEMLFDLLGLEYAKEGKKCQPFSQNFRMLGLQVNTAAFHEGSITVGHTEERRQELKEFISSILDEGQIDSKTAERLRGRMIFFESYACGRVANLSVKMLGRYCLETSRKHKLNDEVSNALLFLKNRALQGMPLQISSRLLNTWIIFTDGAFEATSGIGSVGGVLFSPNGFCENFFGEEVPEKIMKALLSRSQNPIHDLEIMPVFLACLLWGKSFSFAPIVYYIDNESARMAFVRGSGSTPGAARMVHAFVEREAEFQHKCWFARVPSFSNCADQPSRLCFDWVLQHGGTQTSIDWERVFACLDL